MIIKHYDFDDKESLINSDEAAFILGISRNHLRQMVYRKTLVPLGRHKRVNRFLLADVLALKTRRDKIPVEQG